MAGSLNMSNNKTTNVGNPTADKDAVSRVYGDGRYVEKSGDTMTGALSVPDLNLRLGYNVIKYHVLNYKSINKYYFSQSGGKIGTTFCKGYISTWSC